MTPEAKPRTISPMGKDFKLTEWIGGLFTKRDDLPRDLTTADWIKTLAVVLMVVDHIGYYLFPDFHWFRVIGRPGMPIWFFLVGFARKQDLPNRWLIAGVILVAASIAVGQYPLPLNALFSLALCRLVIVPLWDFMARNPIYMWWIVLLLLVLGPPTDMVIEYGTFGLLFAMAGYAARNREVFGQVFANDPMRPLFIGTLVVFILYQWGTFGFSTFEASAMIAGFIGVGLALLSYENKALPGTANAPQGALVRFCGRYTLEIYVIHLLILKGVYGLQKLAALLV